MKYKNIASAIHNFAASFTSLMNYVDGDYVLDELRQVREHGGDIDVDWISGRFEPAALATPRILASVSLWRASLEEHLAAQNVRQEALTSLRLHWPARARQLMVALDDRGKRHAIYVNESK